MRQSFIRSVRRPDVQTWENVSLKGHQHFSFLGKSVQGIAAFVLWNMEYLFHLMKQNQKMLRRLFGRWAFSTSLLLQSPGMTYPTVELPILPKRFKLFKH